ncbi:hypothetical protein DPMN_039430 [Dreissena polymorpha]|uniref:Uncharacterized protein n=1 Tax=Dreissena polymorpha TaxID=45954 RepID=A0A9D4MIW6_DREPO|nr:hypothetical protein DPMN_039430 [Dreissena polymorpha]
MESGDSNTTANTTDIRNTSLLTENLYLEEHSSFILCASVLIGLVSLTSCILAVTILLRTRKVPKSTKYLVTALLVFDCIFVTYGPKIHTAPFAEQKHHHFQHVLSATCLHDGWHDVH